MVSSNDLILFYLGLELQSLSLYILASFDRKNIKSAEVRHKIFCFERTIFWSSSLWLFTLLYVSGSTNFELLKKLKFRKYWSGFCNGLYTVGLAFKISAVPFHMWTL